MTKIRDFLKIFLRFPENWLNSKIFLRFPETEVTVRHSEAQWGQMEAQWGRLWCLVVVSIVVSVLVNYSSQNGHFCQKPALNTVRFDRTARDRKVGKLEVSLVVSLVVHKRVYYGHFSDFLTKNPYPNPEGHAFLTKQWFLVKNSDFSHFRWFWLKGLSKPRGF